MKINTTFSKTHYISAINLAIEQENDKQSESYTAYWKDKYVAVSLDDDYFYGVVEKCYVTYSLEKDTQTITVTLVLPDGSRISPTGTGIFELSEKQKNFHIMKYLFMHSSINDDSIDKICDLIKTIDPSDVSYED